MKEKPLDITYSNDTFNFHRGHVLVFPNGQEATIIDIVNNGNKTITLTVMRKSTLWQRIKIRVSNRLNYLKRIITYQLARKTKLTNFIKTIAAK